MPKTTHDAEWMRSMYEVSDGGCWLWTGAKSRLGYGCLRVGGKYRSAHRHSWMIHRGSIPVGMCVLHKCDVRSCVNPDHLFIGTQLENVADRDAKGRMADTKGTRNGRAKVNEDVVRRMRASGSLREAREIGAEFGMSRYSVYSVMSGRSWGWLGA